MFDITIQLVTDEMTPAQSWKRDSSTYVLALALFAPGYFSGSEAMTWVGAIIFFVAILGAAGRRTKRLTIAQARAELDRIETEQGAAK